jgi:hypothetical protein
MRAHQRAMSVLQQCLPDLYMHLDDNDRSRLHAMPAELCTTGLLQEAGLLRQVFFCLFVCLFVSEHCVKWRLPKIF